ncbi:T9SS type A sorting domain-containing protein [Tamlana flava]|uniref:T9SS type A sorting domain-containing protein n=1 Tax=Tamlana flava TaxID=3158572 RepID=UPI00351AD60A
MKNTAPLVSLSLFLSMFSSAQSVAFYDITFESVWESVADNPNDGISTIDLPPNAHWSPLTVVTHKTEHTFLMMGALASPGIESIAETGATSTFVNEVETNSDANQVVVGSGLNSAKGTITINNLEVSEDFPLISLASMIAPSPDWFIAVNGENLRSGNSGFNNGWKATFSIDLYPYDAGTEDGNMYSLSNPETNPVGVISSLSNISPFNDRKIGTVTFTYKSSTLSVENETSFKDLIIHPNPGKDILTISNIQNTRLNSIKIYNVLGRLVKSVQVASNVSDLKLNLNYLSKGIYLLTLTDVNGAKTSKKIVLK